MKRRETRSRKSKPVPHQRPPSSPATLQVPPSHGPAQEATAGPPPERPNLEKLARFAPGFLLAAVLVLYVFLMAQPINLITADLGRHLENGRVFVTTHHVPSTNLYSYTFPDLPFVNHHWGSGVVFLLVQKIAGFLGLSLFFLAISLAAFFLFFLVAWEGSRLETAALASLPILPILGTRTEVRPEAFSYLLCGVFLWMLWRFRSGRLGARALFALPAFEVIWVNLHIYFFLGPVLIGAFLVEEAVEVMTKRLGRPAVGTGRGRADGDADTLRPGRVKTLGLIFIATGAATFFNPFGLTGAVYPFRIFQGYGHTILENQSVTGLKNLELAGGYPALFYFQLTLVLLAASWIWALVRRERFSVALLLLSAFASVLGWTAIRNFGLFGYLALPAIAINLRSLWWRTSATTGSAASRTSAATGRLIATGSAASAATARPIPGPSAANGRLIAAACLPLAFAAVAFAKPSYWTSLGPVGVGLLPGTLGAGRFWKSAELRGPIFNNYDIGSYLIYFLYPEERVFVDNRPEAYPATFFNDVYIPLQEDDERWREGMRTYGFNSIVLNKNTRTRWLRNFLQKRLEDPAWAPVYVDDNAVILLRREGPDRKVIDAYELCLAEDARARWGSRHP